MMLIIQLLLLISPSRTKAAEFGVIARDGCQDNCGGVPIPYPFGTSPSCSMSKDFEVSCNGTNNGTWTPYLLGSVKILNISLSLGQARVNNPVSSQCYNSTTNVVEYYNNSVLWDLRSLPYGYNQELNKFVVMGCDTLAYLTFVSGKISYVGGCISRCISLKSLNALPNGSCSGIGCCQIAIPRDTNLIKVDFDNRYNTAFEGVYLFSRCGYALMMETTGFIFNTAYLTTDELYRKEMPVVLDWATQAGSWVISATASMVIKATHTSKEAAKTSMNVPIKIHAPIQESVTIPKGHFTALVLSDGAKSLTIYANSTWH
ncbi:Wall-associated receptor kinase 2 [Rhynchospora pubera]|uniref:Wall-associated receptor kinase 2 n=1 Tax=Rhynchospora pubera TaxID=906938 RepID=A0AAV8FIH8_9POAL|nr:Wall-associated receptor kinase 2 [Rhynchospora pubera]